MYAKRLTDRWRSVAACLRDFGASSQAQALERCAHELEVTEREWLYENLTAQQAADEIGLDVETVRRRIRNGALPNTGKKYAPRVPRHAILPSTDILPSRDSVRNVPITERGEPDVAEMVLRSRLDSPT